MRRTCLALSANPFHNVVSESMSFRAKPMNTGLMDVHDSQYKEQFKEFWSQPVPWGQREYGPKPKIGDPVPLRKATSMVVCARNTHEDPGRISEGEDNDYKVLMMHRQGRGRFTKDECVLPAATLHRADWDEEWAKVLKRLGVKSEFDDTALRISAMRGLLTEDNMLVLPREHGGLAEVEGPPGPKKWHMVVNSNPPSFRQLIEILELPMEPIMQRLKPFRRVQTPETEMFRFDNHCYAVTIDKVPCVKYTISTVGERLFWVSPREALARVRAGLMEMPTPNIILLSELANYYPKFNDVDAIDAQATPPVVLPELVYRENNMSTILLPGDMSHSATPPEDVPKNNLRRIVYTKGEYFGVVPEFLERVAREDDDTTILKKAAPRLLEEANEFDMLYHEVELPQRKVGPQEENKIRAAMPEFQLKDIDLIEQDVQAMSGAGAAAAAASSADGDRRMAEARGISDGATDTDREQLRLINQK